MEALSVQATDTLNTIIGAGAILGGIGYAVGQFLSSRRKGVADSLATALNEITALNQRADRLEEQLTDQSAEVTNLKQENMLLRSLVTGGQPILDEIDRRAEELKEFARAEHEKTRQVIAQIRRDTAT